MREPNRLRDEHRGDLVSELMETLCQEQPRPRARERTLRLVTGGAPLVAAAFWTKAALAQASPWVFSLIGFVGASGATVATALVAPEWVGWDAPPAASSEVPPARRAVGRADEQRPSGAELPAPSSTAIAPDGSQPTIGALPPLDGSDAEAPSALPSRPSAYPKLALAEPERSATSTVANTEPAQTPPVKAAPAASRSANTAAPMTLDQEIASLYQVRVALEQRSPKAALACLTNHRTRFRHPTLGTEAAVLELRALLDLGKRQQAEALGRRLLSASPDGPHAERIRALLGSLDE